MIRLTGIIIYVLISTIFFAIVSIIIGIFGPYSKYANGTIRIWARGILWICGIKVDVIGLENIDHEKPYIYISNHQSNFDILACVAAIPGTVRFVAKKELFRIPIFAQGMYMVGMIPIDRGRSVEARKTLDKAIEKVHQGVSLIIFPEGTRSKDGQIHDFKKGGFVLALNGKIEILPISISGSRHIMEKHTLKLNKGRIKIHFLPSIPTNKLTLENRNELVESVRNKIIEHFDPDYK
jgi:1-acyl-sn-glycerol-3-phosphate acyltransferase